MLGEPIAVHERNRDRAVPVAIGARERFAGMGRIKRRNNGFTVSGDPFLWISITSS